MPVRSIFGKEHNFRELKVDILKLKYYPENPRVHHIMRNLGKNPNQEQIEETMWSKDSTKDLYWDIKQNGLQDPILISEDYYVMEGNTRLCVFRYLYTQAKEKEDKKQMEKWRHIQCEMYPPGLDKLGMHYMLGTWQNKQKTEWDEFEKASYIKRLMEEFNKTIDEISEELKIKKSDIKKMLWVEKTMREGKVTNIKQYSHLEQCYQKPELRNKMNKNPEFKKRIIKLIKSGNLGRAENIRRLPNIINKKEDGLDMLEKGVPFDKVYVKALGESPDENPILKDILKLSKKLEKIDILSFFKEIEKDREKIKGLKNFFQQVDNLKKLCKKKKLIKN